MKKFFSFAAMGILLIISLATTLFPLIISFYYQNFFLLFIYFIWWAPAFIIFTIITVIAKLIFEFLD
jgi:hypothetical protein